MLAATQFDTRSFRRTMSRFASGITVLATPCAEGIHAMTANAFVSVSLEPPLVLVSVAARAVMHSLLQPGVPAGISVLAAEQAAESDRFAGRAGCADAPRWECLAGAPVLSGALAQITGTVAAAHVAGDHTLFVLEVHALAERAGRPLLFYDGAYAMLQ